MEEKAWRCAILRSHGGEGLEMRMASGISHFYRVVCFLLLRMARFAAGVPLRWVIIHTVGG